MKTIKTIISLFVFCAFCNITFAQNALTKEEIKKERFTMSFTMGSNNQVNQLKIKSSKGKSFIIFITYKRELNNLKLDPGTIVNGMFRFNKVTNLDSVSGKVIEGTGTLTFKSVKSRSGKQVACPPLCKKSIKLGLKLKS